MSKVIFVLFIGSLVATIISARSTDNAQNTCDSHGASCVPVNNCCPGLSCHRFSERCTVVITADMLQKGKQALKKTDSKYKYW